MTKKEFEEKFGYTLDSIDQLRKDFKSKRGKKERLWKLLDAYDSGEFWETMRAKLPKHQIIPDTNYVFYVKDNIVNSSFSAPYIADVLPIDPGDDEESRTLNKFIEFEYNRQKLGYNQLKIGMRAALINVGFLQGAWDASAEFTIGDQKNKGEMQYIPRDAMATLLDPNYEDFQDGRALFFLTEDSYENTVAQYPDAKDALDESMGLKEGKNNERDFVNQQSALSQAEVGKGYTTKGVVPMTEGMVPIFIAFKKEALESGGYRIDQIIYTNDMVILDARQGIKPNYFPVVALYNYPPEKDAYGTGITERVLRNSISLNVLDSVSVTHAYAAQRTPWIVDTSTGLDPHRIKKDLNKPDRVFSIAEGDPTTALYRLEFPALPDKLPEIKKSLEEAIHRISGVDDKYTGRDTASINTTGGMERLQSRVSMTDNTRINMIEKYAVDLTRMTLDFYVEHGGKRSFSTNPSYEDQQKEALDIDFTKYKKNKSHRFSYHIDASPLLPKNRARLAEAANTIMQVQMQYQGEIELLTPEEWLFFQDFPQKDMILDRMKLDRLRQDYEEVASEITSFQAMTEQGMPAENAVQQLADERAAKREPSVMKNQLNQKE